MTGRQLLGIAWPAFLAACLLQTVVFALVDPLELQWASEHQPWTRQAVHTAAFFLFWAATLLSSALTVLLGTPGAGVDPPP